MRAFQNGSHYYIYMTKRERIFGDNRKIPPVTVFSETDGKPLNLELEVKLDFTKRLSSVEAKTGKVNYIIFTVGELEYFQLCERGRTAPVRRGSSSYEIVVNEELANSP